MFYHFEFINGIELCEPVSNIDGHQHLLFSAALQAMFCSVLPIVNTYHTEEEHKFMPDL